MNSRSSLPLSPLQQRFWFLEQMESEAEDNVISLAYYLDEALDGDMLRQRLDDFLSRCEVSRLGIARQGDEVIQHVLPIPRGDGVNVVVTRSDLDVISEKQIEQNIRDVRKALIRQGDGLNFRVDLVVMRNSSVLILAAKRMVFDNLSLEHFAAHLLDAEVIAPTSFSEFASNVLSVFKVGQPGLEKVKHSLADGSYVCELPLDHTRPSVQKGTTSGYLGSLSGETLGNIEKLSQVHGVSQETIALAAFFSLIYRYTLQDDILVGQAYRSPSQAGSMIGPFTDIAIIRQKFENEISFQQLLQALQSFQAENEPYSAPSFPLLVEALNPERDPSRAPLVQHGFEFHPAGTFPLEQVKSFRRVSSSASISQLDLMLSIRSGEATADWYYDTAIFSPDTVCRFHDHYEALIASAVDDAQKPVKQLSMMTPEEIEQVTIAWNSTSHPVQDNDYVYRLFEKQAVRTPDAVAARQPGQEITYQDLNRRANRLAHQLVKMGIGADQIVSILADRNIDYLVSFLAVNKAGGAFLPLSPSYPARRLAQIYERSDTPLVLVGENYLEPAQEALQYMEASGKPGIHLIKSLLEQDGPESNLPARCEMHHLAYVMFTSGSTGEPKGVMVQHKGNINHIYAKIGDLEMGSGDILAQTSRQSFDIVVWQFLAPLINGGSIYIMPDEIAFDPAQLIKAADENAVTVLQLVPVNIEALLDVADAMGENRPRLSSLRWMVPTGDALPTDLCRRWLNLYPHTRMLNTYGATECSDDQCHYVIPVSPPADYRPPIMTIGRPIINTQVYVLDDALKPVPVGVIGELYIGGIGVGRGYLKDPERTARTFIPNPFNPDPEARLYRSGDQSRYLPDGTVEFIGRIGHMIKIRGMRIEPGEIQSVLGRHPRVAQATLVVHEFPELGAQLVAYIVFRKGESVSDDQLRQYLRQYLPEYMIPSFFVVIDSIPLNANGKIDRKALPVPAVGSLKTSIVEPRDPREVSLLAIWRKVLGRDRLGIHDNFFDVGGNSLLAMKLFSQVEQVFGKRLPLATIFRATTIAELAVLLDDASSGEPEDIRFANLACVVPIQAGDPSRPPFFCVHAGGGNVIFFRDLARYLGKDQTFYGIQALGVDGNYQPLNRYEDMAAVYVKEMRQVQPEGPYYIGGECLGGTLGFEVVRQLEAQGQKVGLIVMFDAYCAGIPTLAAGMPLWLYQLLFHLRRSRIHFTRLRTAPWSRKLGVVGEMFKMAYNVIAFAFLGWRTTNPLSLTEAALDQAEKSYKPGMIDTPITLFNSRPPLGVNNDETLGWKDHSRGGVEIHRLPTTFDLMIESPAVKITAEYLRKLLDEKFSLK